MNNLNFNSYLNSYLIEGNCLYLPVIKGLCDDAFVSLNYASNLFELHGDLQLTEEEQKDLDRYIYELYYDILERIDNAEIVKEEETYRLVKIKHGFGDANDLYLELMLSSFEQPEIESVEQYYLNKHGVKAYGQPIVSKEQLKGYAYEWADSVLNADVL